MPRKKLVKYNGPQPGTKLPVKRQCFRCDGTGMICDKCGESEAVGCNCEDGFSDCPDCGGTGK